MSVSALFLLVLVGLNCVWARTTLNPGKGALTPANCGREKRKRLRHWLHSRSINGEAQYI
jgi:hypothetical protein